MKLALAVLASSWLTPALGQVNVLTYHNDFSRTGQNTNETVLTPANVNVNTFGKLFSYAVDGQVYAQPLYVSGLSIPGQGVHNVVFVATQHDSVYAFDADSNAGPSGGLLWHVSLGASAATPNNDFGNRYGAYHDIDPEVGITGTPVIDLATGTLYVDAFTHEGTSYLHRVHALGITDGSERSFSPVVVSVSIPGTGVGSVGGVLAFSSQFSLQRPGLTLAGGKLYIAYSGYADTNPYHGWVIGFDAATLQLLTNQVFNTTPNGNVNVWGGNAGEGGIWMSGNGLAVDENDNLYFETGNGNFNANVAGGSEYGDSFVKLSTTNGLAVADYFTPFNQDSLSASDADLGSGGLFLVPASEGTAAHPHMVIGCGKEGKIYLLDRDNLGHFRANADTQIIQEVPGAVGGTWSSAAYFNHQFYYHGSGDILRAFKLSNGKIVTTPASKSTTTFGFPGATPSVSGNGDTNGVVWDIQADGYPSGPSVLHAYNAANLAQELYNSSQAGNRDNPGGAVKTSVPTIANGHVYVGAQGMLSVFGVTAFIASPSITPGGGLFTNSVQVALSETTPGAVVYYTLDGSTPGTNSTRYSAPFTLTNTTVVKAAAFLTGFTPSPVVSATFLNSAAFVLSPGFLKQEFYSGATRANLEDPAFPTPPDFTHYLTSFEAPMGQGVNYAERVSGFFVPPADGSYVFFVCSDDDSDLFLSTDSSAANKHLIAQETAWSNSREWTTSSGGSDTTAKRSDQFAGTAWPGGNVISLKAGTPYYMEAVHHQGQGGDDLAATVKLAADPDPVNGDAPSLAGSSIETYALSGAYVVITNQPANALAFQSQTATFSAGAMAAYTWNPSNTLSVTYQWQTAAAGSPVFTNMPGATSSAFTTGLLTPADTGRRFRVVASAPGASTNSAIAMVVVVPDAEPPQPVEVTAVDPAFKQVTVRFDKMLDKTSAETGANYRFSPGGIVGASATLDAAGDTVAVVANSALSPNVTNILAISGVADLAGNQVLPNTTISFSFSPVTYAQNILIDGPTAYFRFEESSGAAAAANSVPGGAPGAYYTGDEPSPGAGGAPSSAAGDPGPRPPSFAGFDATNRSATFDGSSRWVDAKKQYLQDQPAFTLEYWIMPAGRGGWGNRVGIVGQNDAVEYGFIDPGTIQIWTPNGGSLSTAYSFPDNEWHHVATIADGSSIKTYYDGALQGEASASTGDYGASAYNVHIGGGGVFDPTGNYFTGNIDEVAIFTRAISESRVAAHYQAGKSGGIITTSGEPSPVPLRFLRIDTALGQVAIQWIGAGTLEESASLLGPWAPSANQNNPQSSAVSGVKFYRLRQ